MSDICQDVLDFINTNEPKCLDDITKVFPPSRELLIIVDTFIECQVLPKEFINETKP